MSRPSNDLEAVSTWARTACILEAWARKPGNVHPGRSFADTRFEDFVQSAAACAEPLGHAASRPLGETVLAAVKATRARTGKNTNLGIVLLLAPLCAAPLDLLEGARSDGGRRKLRDWLRGFLERLTVRDAELVYEAIRVAAPGGLGSEERGDVRGKPAGTLLAMMDLARERDLIARQYANAYEQVFEEGLIWLEESIEAGRSLENAIVLAFLRLLSRNGDTLIERKCGKEASNEAACRAGRVIDLGWPDAPGSDLELEAFDAWLRCDGHRRNPGAAADLIAAVLFLALASGIISPDPTQIQDVSNGMQKYKIRVTKDYLTFCSAHFISFEGTQCERLHGHNYKVYAEIEAPLNEDYLVFDFIVLKNILRDIANELDHRMLVPVGSKTLRVVVKDDAVEICYRSKRWVFPREDCALLEIENTTAELLARWISGRLREAMLRHAKAAPSPPRMPEVIRVEVEESPGQSATYETAG